MSHPSQRAGVTAAPSRRKSARNRRNIGTSSIDNDYRSNTEEFSISRESSDIDNLTTRDSYSINSGRYQPRADSASSSIVSKSSYLKSPLFARGLSNREREYNDSLSSPSDMQRPVMTQENSGTSNSIRSISSKSSRYRPGNSALSNRVGTINSDNGSMGSGFPRSVGGNSSHSYEQLGPSRVKSHHEREYHSPYDSERGDTEGHLMSPQGGVAMSYNLERIQQEESDDSEGSNMSDIMMRPSSHSPYIEHSDNEGDEFRDFEDNEYEQDPMVSNRSSEGSFVCSGSDTSKADASVAHVLRRLAGTAVDDDDDNALSEDDNNDEFSQGNDNANYRSGDDAWSEVSVSDQSGMSGDGSGIKDMAPPTPIPLSKARHFTGQVEEPKQYIAESYDEGEYYNRIRESTVSAYNNEDEVDDDSTGSEDLDVLGNIPTIFYSRQPSKDEDEEISYHNNSHGSIFSISDDDDKKEELSPGVVTARAIRPQNNKANRPTRKKPANKLPVNPLIAKTDSNLSSSQLSTNSHSDGGSTVLARHNGSFVSGGLHRVNDQASRSASSISGGLRRINNSPDDSAPNNRSTSRMSVSGGLRRVESSNQASKSFFGRSMLMLKMFTGNNANNASMSSVPTDTGGETSNSSSPPPPNTTNHFYHNASNSQLMNKKMNRSQSGSQHSLLTDVAETVYSVNTVEMKNPGTFLHSRNGESKGATDSFNNLLDENISKLQQDKSRTNVVKQPSRDSDASDDQEEKVKSEKFKRMMLMKKQYSSSRANHGFLCKQNSSNASKELKATQSMAIMIQKANQLDKQRVALKQPTTSSVSNQSKGKGIRKGKGDMRKSSAMVMNMQGLGMNMAEISKNLERTVTRSGSNFSSATTDARRPAHRKMLIRQQGGSIKSLGGNVKGSRDHDDDESGANGGDDDNDDDTDKDEDDDEMDYLLELDCGPNLDNPILSYKQAQRVRAFHMPGLIEADTMTLIQHPLNSKFGWFEFPFRRIFAKDPSPSDMVIEKYGIGVILWFRFLKAFAIVFIVMFVVNVPAMSMFYHGTYYPAARTEKRIDNSPTDILTTTTMGNLGVQLQYCHVVNPGEEIYIDCFGGVVENIIAFYGTPSGECSCPSVQQPKKSGDCPGSIIDSGGGSLECELGRYNKKLACFDSTFRREKCCGFELDAYGEADLSSLSLSPDYTCNSLTAQYIATGMCLGKESCVLGTDATQEYHWEGELATNLNNTDVCETGFDSGNFNTSDSSFCTTTLGYSGIWDSCPEANTQTLKLNVKCSEKDIKAFGTEMSRPTIVLTASILNALAVSTFIFAVFWVSKEQEAEDAEMDRSTCRATDYTIRCVRLPEHNSSNELANKLKKHFESKLSKCKPCFLPGKVRVADINLTTGSFKYLQAAIKRGKASRELDLVRYKKTVMDYLNEEKSLRYKFFEKWEEHALRTFAKYNDICLKKFVASLNGDKKVIIAYVTFETEEGFLRALANNIPIQGKQMTIKRAEDPSDILWENLGTPVMYRLIRRSITTLLLIVLLLMTYFIVAYAIETSERNSTDWPFIIACDDFVVSLDKNDNSTDFNVITYEKTLRDHKWQYYNNTAGRQGYVNCYCQSVMNEGTIRRALDYVFYDAELDSEERWCKNLLWDEFTLLVIKLAVSMVVLSVNLSAKTILHVLKEFERMASYSLISQSMTVKLFMIQIVNTGMLALLMNGDAGLNKENTVAFMNGDYEDFTPEWYDDIGKTVLQTVTLYCIGVHGVKFAVFFLHKFLRWRDRGFGSDVRITKQVSQENLNKLFIGPEFVIEVRYATVLTICFVCIAYGPAMPLLYLIGGLGFWATYLIDKWFFLRVYRIPHATSPQLAHSVTKSLYFSAILNLVLSVWIYSNIMLFDPVTKGEETEVMVNGLKFLEVSFSFHSYDSVSERIFSQYALASWVVLIPFILFLVVLLLTYFLNEHNVNGGKILSRFLNMINTERAFEGNPPYFSVIPATLIVRRLEEGMAKPHILAAYEKQLRKVELEGEEDKLMEGLESYKIELNEIYADKIAINSDYMGKVRPIDLFTEEEELEEVDDDNSVAGDGSVVNGLTVNTRRMSVRKGLSRSNTVGVGLSGADYEFTVTPDTTPVSGQPEKDIFTLLKEKKQAMRERRKSLGGVGDELKQQSDSCDDDDESEEDESERDDDHGPLLGGDSGVKKSDPGQHPFYTSVGDDYEKKLSEEEELDELKAWEREKDKDKSLTDKEKDNRRKSKQREKGNIELGRENEKSSGRHRDKDRRHSSKNPVSNDDPRNNLTTTVSTDTGENRRFRRGSRATDRLGDVVDLPVNESIIPKEGGSEKRYYEHTKRADKYHHESDHSRGEKRRGSHSVDQSRDDSARSSRDKTKRAKSSEKRRRDREDSDERRHRHRQRDRDNDRDRDQRGADGRRHRDRESSGGERKHRDRDRRDKERDSEKEKEKKEERRHRGKEKSRSDKGRDNTKDRESSREPNRRKSSHGRETGDGKDKSSRRHQPRRISLPETPERIASHRADKKGKELELGFLSASKKTRMERIADNKNNVESVEKVTESLTNLF